jgi:hypothetical protein
LLLGWFVIRWREKWDACTGNNIPKFFSLYHFPKLTRKLSTINTFRKIIINHALSHLYCSKKLHNMLCHLTKSQLSSSPYKLSLKEEEALRKEIKDVMKSGIISLSDAAGGCPISCVKTPDETSTKQTPTDTNDDDATLAKN